MCMKRAEFDLFDNESRGVQESVDKLIHKPSWINYKEWIR